MIFIVIDNSSFEKEPTVLGVYREHSAAEEFILSIPEDENDFVSVVCWDIVKNVEVV